MTILHALILGVVEGLTEFLPISSTGHLILAGELLKIPSTDFYKSFEIVIQLGAILSVVALYWRSFLDIEVLKRLALGFIPTGIIGLALYRIVKTYLLGDTTVVIWSLFLGGVVLIVFELSKTESFQAELPVTSISYKQSIIVGLFQSVAIIPGVSRSAATILGGLLLGIPRRTIVEFSFLLAVPTMAAATGLDIIKSASTFTTANVSALAVGFVTSFIVALFSIKFLLRFVRTHSFTTFGVYRIAAAGIFWLLLA